MSLDLELQKDLHEAFKLLYDEEPDDFDFDQEDEEEEELDEIVNESPAGNGRGVVKSRPIDRNKISKRRLQEMLEILIPSDPLKPPRPKRRRLLPSLSLSASSPDTTISDTPTTYSPHNLSSYRARLLTYSLRTYHSKPLPLKPQNVARFGWRNPARETLECDTCGARWVLKGLDGQGKRGGRIVELYTEALSGAHKGGCPWRVQVSPESIHKQLLNLHPLLSSRISTISIEVQKQLSPLEQPPNPIRVKSALREEESDHLERYLLEAMEYDRPEEQSELQEVSRNSMVLAFFGWIPLTVPSSSSSTTSSTSSSVPPFLKTGTGTRTTINNVLTCSICERKLDLLTFLRKGIELDPIKEHKEFCPLLVYARSSDGDGQGGMDGKGSWWDGSVLLRAGTEVPLGLDRKDVLGRIGRLLGGFKGGCTTGPD